MPGGGYIFITAVRNCKAAADQRETPTKPPPTTPHPPLGMSSFYAEFLFADSRCPFCDEFLIRGMFNCGVIAISRWRRRRGGIRAISRFPRARSLARRFCRVRRRLRSNPRADYRSLSDGVNWKSDYTGDKVQRLSEEMSLRIVRIPNQSTTQIRNNL